MTETFLTVLARRLTIVGALPFPPRGINVQVEVSTYVVLLLPLLHK